MINRIVLLSLLVPGLASAQGSTDEAEHKSFVQSNILAVFYHELGHAVIDSERVPIFGQEEDAADVFSTFLIHTLFEDEPAQEIAFHTAMSFLGEVEFAAHSGREDNWWGVHAPNRQRFFNTVCLFYGANPETREAFAKEMDLPAGRAVTCPTEFAQAEGSWGAVFADLIASGPGKSLIYTGTEETEAGALLAYEVEELNAILTLSTRLEVTVEICDEANAFYDPNERKVIFCTEFETYFREMARWMF